MKYDCAVGCLIHEAWWGISEAFIVYRLKVNNTIRYLNYSFSNSWLVNFNVRLFSVTVRTTWSGAPEGISASTSSVTVTFAPTRPEAWPTPATGSPGADPLHYKPSPWCRGYWRWHGLDGLFFVYSIGVCLRVDPSFFVFSSCWFTSCLYRFFRGQRQLPTMSGYWNLRCVDFCKCWIRYKKGETWRLPKSGEKNCLYSLSLVFTIGCSCRELANKQFSL